MRRKNIIITILGFYVLWLLILPFTVSKMVNFVCTKSSINSEYNVSIEKLRLKLSILPIARISAEEILIKNKSENSSLKITNPKLKIRILPLLTGKVHINKFNANNIEFNTLLAKDFDFNKKIKTNNIKLTCDSININKYKVILLKENIKEPIVYEGNSFVFKKKNRYKKLHLKSFLKIDTQTSKINLDIYLPKNNDINKTNFIVDIDNINIAPFKAYLRDFFPNDLQELQGILTVNANKDNLNAKLINFQVKMTDNAKTMTFPDVITIDSKFKILQNSINFENIDINSKKIKASLEGQISNIFDKVSLDLKLRLNKSRIEDIINLLPAFEIEELDVYKLKKYQFYGDVLANLSIIGKLPEPNIWGDIYIDNGILTKPIPNTSKGATIKLSFKGRDVVFDANVPAGNSEFVKVQGNQEIYNIKYANLTVKSSDSVNLGVAQTVVNPLHEILNFVIGPVPIMNINGKGNIDILVNGNRKNPYIDGTFNIKDGVAFLNEIPDLKIKNIDATLIFEDKNVKFINNNGTLNNENISINGNCNLDGAFNFHIASNNQPTELLYKAIQNSTLIPELTQIIPKIDSIKGLLDLDINIFGNVKHIEDLKFNKNAFAKGNIEIKNNNIKHHGFSVENINGKLKFENLDFDTQIDAKLAYSPLKLSANVKNNIANINFEIPKLNPNFLFEDLTLRKKQYLPYISISGKYKDGDIITPELNKIEINAKILGSIPDSKIIFNPNGTITIDKGNIFIKNVKGFIVNPQNLFNIEMNIDNAFAKKFNTNGIIKIKSPDLTLINDFISNESLQKELNLKNYEFKNGALDSEIRVVNNKINTNIDLSGISFTYLPLNLPIEILNGNINIKNNNLKANKINVLLDKMPLLIDGTVKDFLDKQVFDLYFNSKPQQEFIDKYINKNQIYPIKIKGDILYWLKIKGIANLFDLNAQIDMSKNSSFYHYGATVGDIENAIQINIDSTVVDRNYHKIKEFRYDKLIDSLSGKQTKLNLLKAFGNVKITNKDLLFENLHIKTNHPTDARIFNIIFRKPNIKQGQFTSDLKINGSTSSPKVIGSFHIFETNIPFLDTTMKNIELLFKERTIDFDAKGEILNNDIIFNGVLKNKLTPPYKIERANLYTKELDLNNIINKLKIAEAEEISTFDSLENFNLKTIITKNFILKADSIKLRNIQASDFEAKSSLSERGLFEVDDFSFNIAQGTLSGKYSYNLDNNDIKIDLNANSINANDITWAIFDLNNQIYGDLTGNINLKCNGADFNACMETLSGSSIFNVKNGKMPKLGSLEYLLKASNLVKGGFTGVSINSFIDLIAPADIGEFDDIFGSIRIKDGVARNIEITTKGKDLSLFIGGTYNFATSIADMEVLGLLSRKFSTMLGPIGNMSINTLFNLIPGVDLSKDSAILERINRIPGIELSSKAYRKFIAKIKGNINGDDYVTSFQWIN